MWRLAFALVTALGAGSVIAGEIQLQIEETLAEKFQIIGLEAQLDFSKAPLTLSVHADSLILPAPIGEVSAVDFDCTAFQLQSTQWRCQEGIIAFQHALLGAQTLTISDLRSQKNEQFSLMLTDLEWAGGNWSLTADWQPGAWQADITAPTVDAEQLQTALQTFVPDLASLPAISGTINVATRLQGQGQNLSVFNSEIGLQSLAFSGRDGALAAENITAQFDISANRDAGGWQWQQQSRLTAGELYVAPVYLDITTNPLTLSASGQWQSENNHVAVSQFDLQHQDVMSAEGALSLDDLALQSVHAELASTQLQTFYDTWLQPFVFDTAAADLALEGQLNTTLNWQTPSYDLDLQLTDVDIKDNQQRFDWRGLNGNLAWTSREQPHPINLQWQAAQLYQIAIGGAQIQASAVSHQISLSESLSLPVLDGALQLDDFQLTYPPGESVTWSFEGLLKPVSMPVLSEALDWPVLQGKLSGVIPSVRYQNQQVAVDGALMVKVFEGTTIIRDLQLQQPFGVLPHLSANVDINQLDLQTLTTAFDFGRISGTLDGYIHDLQLSNWQPVQFDAWLATDENSDTPRRISQRAVNNLSQLGGGPGGLLSRSFLRFFDDFSYKRLGLGCRLSRSICEMRGVSEADAGYYIVEGGGLPPWINVIGYNRQVNWPVLIDRLQAVSQSEGPVIE